MQMGVALKEAAAQPLAFTTSTSMQMWMLVDSPVVLSFFEKWASSLGFEPHAFGLKHLHLFHFTKWKHLRIPFHFPHTTFLDNEVLHQIDIAYHSRM